MPPPPPITWETKKQDQVFRNLARHAEDHRQLTAPGSVRLLGSQGSPPFIQREALLRMNQEWDCALVPSLHAPGPGRLAREGEGQHQADHPTWAGLRVLLQCLFLKWTPIVEQSLEVGRR